MAKTSDMSEGPRSTVKEVMESEGLSESGTVRVNGKSVREPRCISAEQDEGAALCTGFSERDSLGSVTKPDSTPIDRWKKQTEVGIGMSDHVLLL